jgi:hypothetical protein
MARDYAVQRSRQHLAITATAALVGIALSAAGVSGGPLLTVGSLLLLIVALHRFGRTGADGGSPARGRRRSRPRRSMPPRAGSGGET